MCVSRCARCGDFSYEQLRTHGYCARCNYSSDLETEDSTTLSTLAWACRIVDERAKNQTIKPTIPLCVPAMDHASLRFSAALQERKEIGSRAC